MQNEPVLAVAVYLIVGTFLFLLGSAFWKRRDAIVFFVRRLFVLEITYLGVALIAIRVFGQPPFVSLLLGIVAALVIGYRLPSRRKRYIRASVRRRVIARYELRTGEKFDSRIHEIDHTIPFSKAAVTPRTTFEWLTKWRTAPRALKIPGGTSLGDKAASFRTAPR